jgi:hypothetical protein
VERYEKALIESLGSELQPLEMPGVALFTLVVGLLLTTFIGKLLQRNPSRETVPLTKENVYCNS